MHAQTLTWSVIEIFGAATKLFLFAQGAREAFRSLETGD
jgi:hypothetical protein